MRLIKHLKITLSSFFSYYPAWGYALCVLLLFFVPQVYFTLLLPLIFLKSLRWIIGFSVLFHLCAQFSSKPLPSLESSFILEGVFTPRKMETKASFFKEIIFVKGDLKTQKANYEVTILKEDFLDNKCHLILNVSKQEGFIKCDVLSYRILGDSPWIYKFRKSCNEKIKTLVSNIYHPDSSHLLFSLFSGQLEQKLLKLQFQNHGLAHVLALSGFHLNLIILFLEAFFIKLLKIKYADEIIILSVLAYVLFIGLQPSIVRAFGMSFSAYLFSKRYFKVDTLQTFIMSFFLAAFLCYYKVLSAAFVLSFIATLALITFKPIWEMILNIVGDPITIWENIIYKFMKLFCLQCFLFIMTLPSLAYFFGSVNLSSVFYNLIYPAALGFFMLFGAAVCLIKSIHEAFGDYLLDWLFTISDFLLLGLKKPINQSSVFPIKISTLWYLAILALQLFMIFLALHKKTRCSKSHIH